MKIKDNSELLIFPIFIIPGFFWVFIVQHYIAKANINIGRWGDFADYCEAIFIIISTTAFYLSSKILRTKIKQSEKQYQKVFEINSVPMGIYDKKTLKFLLVNDAAVNTYGYSREEFISMSIKDFTPKEELGRLEDNILHNQEKIRYSEIRKHAKKDGNIILTEICADDVMLYEKECRLISAHNLTSLVKAKDEIQEGYKKAIAKEELMRTAEHLANFGSWEVNLKTGNSKCSDGFFGIYGYPPQTVDFTFDRTLSHIHPDDLEKFNKVYYDALYKGASPKSEFRIIDNKGKLKYIRSDFRIERNDQQQPMRLQGFNLDITETQLSIEKVKQSHKELQLLAGHMENIREEERIDIAREIHDELGQQLTAVKFGISWVKSKLDQDNHPLIKEKMLESIAMVDETIKSVRRIASKLRPVILDEIGLPAALKWQSKDFEKRTGILCSFTENLKNTELDIDIDKSVAIAFFRIYQEALTNITRHSGADCVVSSFMLDQEFLVMKISDNGKGFDQEEVKSKKSLGLVGIKERALFINAELCIDSKIGTGTIITVKLHCKQAGKTEKL